MEGPPRPDTPPHHPIFGVHMSHERIRLLMAKAYPGLTVDSVSQLPSGNSYNNRIYFIKINHHRLQDFSGQAALGRQELVLKLNGRFFGPDKIQNEVSCLRLMEIHCPNVPAPLVYAWSENGKDFVRISADRLKCQNGEIPDPKMGEQTGGWILMSKIPGESLSSRDWDKATMNSLARQLADMVAFWRQNIPTIQNCGNLLFCNDESADVLLRDQLSQPSSFPAAMARGIIGIPGEANAPSRPITSELGYYGIRLKHALQELETGEVYGPNKHIVPLVHRFATETLPRLSLTQNTRQSAKGAFIFTHNDISPRNVLVSGHPPKITGIIDYEFSGFFPASDEFVQDVVGNDGDWPVEAHRTYLERLEELGVETPLKGMDRHTWQQLLSLGEVIENIAPWWLPGAHTSEGLTAALDKAQLIVKCGIKTLEQNGSR